MLRADVVVIGGGVIGANIARELSRYAMRVVLLEKEADVCTGASGSNGGVVHAGYDPEPGTLKAALNAKGNAMFESLAAELEIPFRRTGSLVIIMRESEFSVLETLLQRGKQNRVPGLEIVTKDRLVQMEPNVNPEAIAALHAPTAAIVCPFALTIALVENAVMNGVEVMLETEATGISVEDGKVAGVKTNRGFIPANFVINAAGVYADEIAAMAGAGSFRITPRKGERLAYDPTTEGMVKRVIFGVPRPSKAGVMRKGGAVTPTFGGNLMVGSTAEEVEDKEDATTSRAGFEELLELAERLVPSLSPRKIISSFAGLRAPATGEDFIIGPVDGVKGFINVAGIQSPGLACAPAIAAMVLDILADEGLKLEPRRNFNPVRRAPVRFKDLSDEEKEAALRRDPRYGTVVCRCEMVTEAEIVECIHGPVGARTADAVKRRTRAGMGPCQGGFCTPRIAAILARELGVPLEQVTKKGGGSHLVASKVGSRRRDTDD